MTAPSILAGWRTYVPVVALNAGVQAATTLPVTTPALSPAFVGLAAASFAALAVSTVLVVAQASADRLRFRAPSARLFAAGALALLTIGVAAVLAPPALVPAIAVALIVLPPIGRGDRWFAGFRAFARRPWASILLVLLTGVAIAALWLGALLSGFFLAGVPSALLTWLGIGAVAVALVRGWTRLTRRASS